MRPDSPLVTLVGPGGVGRDPARGAVAEEVADAFPDGVGFVPLAPIRDPLSFCRRLRRPWACGKPGIVRSLTSWSACCETGAATRPRQPGAGAVRRTSSRRALAACPRLTVLATSRAPLRVSGSARLMSRPCPPHSAEGSGAPLLTDLARVEAVRLFVERAHGALGLRAEWRRTRWQWPRSARDWMGCPWQSSWRRRELGHCRRRRC